MNRFTLLFYLLSATLLFGADIKSFQLEDQRAVSHQVNFPCTNITLIIAADRGGSKEIKPWVEKISSSFDLESFRMVAVADLSAVPKLLRKPTRLAFRSIDFPILLDWDAAVIPSLKVAPDLPSLIVVDHEGMILHSTREKFSEEKFVVFSKKLRSAINVEK